MIGPCPHEAPSPVEEDIEENKGGTKRISGKNKHSKGNRMGRWAGTREGGEFSWAKITRDDG